MRRALALVVAAIFLAPAPTALAAADGRVSGTVTPISVAQEVEVCLVETRPSETCATPAADGSYALPGLPLSTPIKIEFLPSHRSHYLVQYWDGASSVDEAQSVSIDPLTREAGGIDAALAPGAGIEGSVTSPMSHPLPGVEVCALVAGLGSIAGCSQTDSEGGYELPTLPAGPYLVGFFGRGPSAEYVSEYYTDSTTIAGATAVTLTVGEVRSGIDAELAKGAQVRGTVRAAADGESLSSVPVCLFLVGAAPAEQCVFTDFGGGYAFIGLPAGDYQVGFALRASEIDGEAGRIDEEDGYLGQYYDGVASRAAAHTIPISGAEVVEGVDAALLAAAPPPPPASMEPPPAPLVAAALPIAEPKPSVRNCKRGYVKKKRNGKFRCVKKKHSRRNHRHRRHHHEAR